jgi:hypothetical protein
MNDLLMKLPKEWRTIYKDIADQWTKDMVKEIDNDILEKCRKS